MTMVGPNQLTKRSATHATAIASMTDPLAILALAPT
jgi:hypothetical protein